VTDSARSGSLHFEVSEGEAGERLDAALASLAGATRSQVQRWIRAGCVRVNGVGQRASHRLSVGDEVAATPPEPVPASVSPEAIPIEILYSDASLVVVDKPPGLVVHPAPGHPSGTLVNALLHHCGDLSGIGGVLRPGIVHRLDRGTSGVMVAAKNDSAHVHLAEQFREHTIERVYRAFVRGLPRVDEMEIDLPVGRHPRDRKRMSTGARVGRAAHSSVRVIRRFRASDASELEVRPRTGRTHQIRVHLAARGAPILGDPVYGRGASRAGEGSTLERPALHAALLGFVHPETGEALRFEAALPPDLARLRERLEKREGG